MENEASVLPVVFQISRDRRISKAYSHGSAKYYYRINEQCIIKLPPFKYSDIIAKSEIKSDKIVET